ELEPAEALVDFVGELAAYARSRKPGFIIVAQNATELYEEPGYAGLLDGVAQEAVWFDGGGDPDTGKSRGDIDVDPELTEEYLQNLAAWKKMGKTVLDIEYAGDPVKAKKAYELGARYKFKTYVTLRPLDTLTNTPPPRY
ncbi:MAG: endo alpha-1,4 polygalactosaminidase, partial [Actinobacteria bacterium]|nr:endo alpha-1,4 polygalactosaminidase [Actinomycetota bacterium]